MQLTSAYQQLYYWYHNHYRVNAVGTTKQKILPIGQKSRKPHLFQAYIKLHGKRVLPIIRERWKQKLEEADNEKSHKDYIAFQSACAKELFEEEPVEIKDMVTRFRETGLLPTDIEDDSSPEIKELRAKQQ